MSDNKKAAIMLVIFLIAFCIYAIVSLITGCSKNLYPVPPKKNNYIQSH